MPDIDKIDLNHIQSLIESGSAELTVEEQLYLDRLEIIRGLYTKYKSKSFIVNHLVTSQRITREYAVRLYVDSLNYFYANNEVTKDAWRAIYAEKMENLAMVAWETNDLETYRRAIMSAAELRGLHKDEPPRLPDELLDRRIIIYSTDPTKLGIPKISKKELAEFIDNLDITETEKDIQRRDAGFVDVEFEEV